jgi:peptidoglycan/LPS O-acetylase OafA/YrhL
VTSADAGPPPAPSGPPVPGVAAPSKRIELRQLTGLRGAAAVWVVVYHFHDIVLALVPELAPVRFLFESGAPALEIFFVMSGYIIAYQYLAAFPRGRGAYWPYLIKRFARIYPLQLVSLLVVVVLVVGAAVLRIPVTPASSFTVWGAVQDALLIRGWVVPTQGWNFPAWSLSAEWFVYLIFPVIALLIGWAITRRAAVVAVIAACVAVEAAGAVLLPGFNGMPHPLVRVIAGFTLGAALYALGPLRIRPGVAAIAAVVAFVGLAAFGALVPTVPLHAAVALVGAAIAVGGMAYGGGPIVRFLASRIPEYAGHLSYGVYMSHGIVLMLVAVLIGGFLRIVPLDEVQAWPIAVRIGIALATMLPVLPAGMALYHLVERPAQRWITGPLRRQTPPAASIDR